MIRKFNVVDQLASDSTAIPAVQDDRPVDFAVLGEEEEPQPEEEQKDDGDPDYECDPGSAEFKPDGPVSYGKPIETTGYQGDNVFADGDIWGSLPAQGGNNGGGSGGLLLTSDANGMQIRRLTPTECERLQGFPDGHTSIPWNGRKAMDAVRYKALGNSMAVPVMHWIGKRIAAVESIINRQKEL